MSAISDANKDSYDMVPDNVDTSTSGGYVNPSTGLLSKFIDTALDIYSIKESGKKVGTTYPTGQTNPAAVDSATKAAADQAALKNTYLKYGLGAVVGIIAIVVLVKALK